MDVVTTLAERPRYTVAIADDVLRAGNRLRNAFFQKPMRFAPPDEPIVRLTDSEPPVILIHSGFVFRCCVLGDGRRAILNIGRSEEHTSELQSHSFISYAVFCLKK